MLKTFRSIIMCSAAVAVTSIGAGQIFAQTPTFPNIQKPTIKPKLAEKPKPNYQYTPTVIKPMLATKVAMLDGRLDASLIRPDGIALFLVNDNYAGYDIPRHKLGFTRTHDLQGVPKDVNAALMHPINRKGYFFKGNTYYRYDFFKKKTDKVGKIGQDGWKGISGPIDAALTHPYSNHVYFFKGDRYQKFSLASKKVVASGTIGVDDWIGIPEDVDGAFLHSNGKAYFFKSNTYHRYDFAKNRRDKKGEVGKDGWRNVHFAKDNRATENTNRLAKETVKLRVTLKSIKMIDTDDGDGIADLVLSSGMVYTANGKNKTFVNRVIKHLKQPEITVTRNREKDNEHHLIITADGTAYLYPYLRNDKKMKQLHIQKGQTKTINNSMDFLVSVDEATDQQANFQLWSSVYEVDDCDAGAYGDCDTDRLEAWNFGAINVYEVLKYLKNPNNVSQNYFSVETRRGGPYHDYGNGYLQLKKGEDGGLDAGTFYSGSEKSCNIGGGNCDKNRLIMTFNFQLVE